MSCIYYLILFNNTKIQALLDVNNKFNIINPIFTNKLGFSMNKIIIKAQKIDKSILKVYKFLSPE